MDNHQLAIYYFDACPYCQIVMEVIDDLDLKVEKRDVRQDRNHFNKLIQDTGRSTVPCLYIDNQPMHESADIVRWLKTNGAKLTKNG